MWDINERRGLWSCDAQCPGVREFQDKEAGMGGLMSRGRRDGMGDICGGDEERE